MRQQPDTGIHAAEIPPFISAGNSVRIFPGFTTYHLPSAHIDGRRYFAHCLRQFEERITERQGGGIPFKYKWSDAQAEIIRGLIKHAINDPDGPFDMRKGWYLWGDVQIGKTTLARALQHFHAVVGAHQKRPTNKYFKISDVRDMYSHFRVADRLHLGVYVEGDRAFDDVGVPDELEKVNIYGQERDPMADILWDRFKRWETAGLLTYATSNLPFEDTPDNDGGIVPGWISRFDERLQDRLRQMITPIYFPYNPEL